MNDDQSLGVGQPPHVDLPLFVYGALKSTEPAHSWIAGHLKQEPAQGELSGYQLLTRDGFPLLVAAGEQNSVHGEILYLDAQGYDAVAGFENRHNYAWGYPVAVMSDGVSIGCNTLLGRRPQRGTDGQHLDRWSGRDDPLLTFGLDIFADLAAQALAAAHPLPSDMRAFWPGYLQVQANYLLLWSMVERFALLRFGMSAGPTRRISRMDHEYRTFASGHPVVAVRRADRPDELLRSDVKPFSAWYQIRSNQVHQGKSAIRDIKLIATALVGLHGAFRGIVDEQWPSLAHRSPGRTVSLRLPGPLRFTANDYPVADQR